MCCPLPGSPQALTPQRVPVSAQSPCLGEHPGPFCQKWHPQLSVPFSFVSSAWHEWHHPFVLSSDRPSVCQLPRGTRHGTPASGGGVRPEPGLPPSCGPGERATRRPRPLYHETSARGVWKGTNEGEGGSDRQLETRGERDRQTSDKDGAAPKEKPSEADREMRHRDRQMDSG